MLGVGPRCFPAVITIAGVSEQDAGAGVQRRHCGGSRGQAVQENCSVLSGAKGVGNLTELPYD